MKIMHIISGGDKGGAKTHMFALLDELCKMADVTVVCLMRGVFYEEIIERDVRTVLLEQNNRMDFSVCRKIEKMAIDEGFDIINVHGARANVIAMRLNKRKLNIPIVTTVHSDPLLDFDGFIKRSVFMNLNLVALKRLKYKIAVSDYIYDMLTERGYMPNDIRTVYNGMDFRTEEEHISKEEFARKYNIPYDPENVYMGVAARFSHVKGVDIFIKSAAKVLKKSDKARFVIIGEGEDESKLKALAKDLGIADKIYFLGFVKEIYDFFNFIDINMLTSRSEGFPYCLLEGAKAHKATIATAIGGIAQLIIEGETGLLFESENTTECADKILYLINNRDKIQELGEAIYQKASSEFSNEALAKAYLNNYKTFIKKYNRKKKYDILLSGYYGFDNFGDDLVLMLLVERLRKHIPDIEIVALAKNPKNAMRRYKINCKHRYRPLAVKKTIEESYNYVNGGGTLLTDVTSRRSLSYYCFMLKYAKKKGLRTMLLGSGIGPFVNRSGSDQAREALSCTDVIALRDSNSLDIIEQLGMADKAVPTADMAFLISPEANANRITSKIMKENSLNADNYFIVALREWKYNAPDFERSVAVTCDYLAQKYSLIPVFIPVQPEKDLAISRLTASLMTTKAVIINRPEYNLTILPGLSVGARFTLSMRLHPIICSFVYARPVIALSYDAKVSGFVEENNAGLCIKVEDVTEDKLKSLSDKLDDINPNTNKESVDALKKLAKKNIDIALENLILAD